jgi:hypothetical protein
VPPFGCYILGRELREKYASCDLGGLGWRSFRLVWARVAVRWCDSVAVRLFGFRLGYLGCWFRLFGLRLAEI